jgi:hypothetical protein
MFILICIILQHPRSCTLKRFSAQAGDTFSLMEKGYITLSMGVGFSRVKGQGSLALCF